ncbi:hypothetical protein BD779DRAFT_1459073 [Infundibulicybe gibba]|nr:hypothetical protein BD779DRAFT_1459073 [Infundibulicybe gibba]
MQATLDTVLVIKPNRPQEFTRKGILESVAKFIACDDQSLAVASKATFRNCLVAMRPGATSVDLPSSYEVTTYMHEQFVQHLANLKADILVRVHTILGHVTS